MKVSTANIIRFLICFIGLVLVVIGLRTKSLAVILAAGAVLVAAFVFWFIFGKCPYCGRFLGKYLNAHCPHCGKKIM